MLAPKHSSSVTALSQTARMQPLDALTTPQGHNADMFPLLLLLLLLFLLLLFHLKESLWPTLGTLCVS